MTSRSPKTQIRPTVVAAWLLTVWGSLLIAGTWTELSPTVDEPTHLAAGMQLLDRGVYEYERLHPPAGRVTSAVGPYLLGIGSFGRPDPVSEGLEILYAEPSTSRTLAAARAGTLPFFWLSVFCVWTLARRLHGEPTAVAAVALFVHLPPILAHAGLATTDMAGTAGLIAVYTATWLWLEEPTWKRTLWLGSAGGLALATKLSNLPFFGLAIIGLLLLRSLVDGRALWRNLWTSKRRRQASAALGLAFLTLWAAYGFGTEPWVGPRERPYRNVDRIVGTEGPLHDRVYRLIETPLMPVVFRATLDGIRGVIDKNDTGHTGFLLGHVDPKGWWYFFPVAVTVKTPLAFLALVLLGLGSGLWRAWTPRDGAALVPVALPLILVVSVMAIGMAGSVNIGLRHVLAIYPPLAVLAAAGLVSLKDSPGLGSFQVRRVIAALLLGGLMWPALDGHPDYLPWFNSLADAPERVLSDSDLDWGQDLDRLAVDLEARGVNHLHLAYFGNADPARHGLPFYDELPMGRPVTGWVAVSLFVARGLYMDGGPQGPYAWLADHEPVTRVGASIDLYFIPPS